MLKMHQIVLLAIIVWTGQIALAQQPVTKTQTAKATATIQAIDSTKRIVTLKNEKGEEDSFRVPPEMKRFNELKVGDRINLTYTESIVVMVQKPGDTAKSSAGAALVPSTGKSPGATLSQQLTTTVTVKAIDPAVPSITVATADGRTVTRKVENKKNIEGIKVGDKLDITYTESVLVNAEPAK